MSLKNNKAFLERNVIAEQSWSSIGGLYLTEEQERIRLMVHDFAQNEIAP